MFTQRFEDFCDVDAFACCAIESRRSAIDRIEYQLRKDHDPLRCRRRTDAQDILHIIERASN